MRLFAQVAVIMVVSGTANAYTFGGFDEGETEYLKRGSDDQACTPAPEMRCHPVDKKAARGYAKPSRTRKLGDAPLAVTIQDEKSIRVAAGDREIGVFAPGSRVTAVNTNVFVSPSGGLVAVEYETVGKVADVVVFATAAPAPAAPEKLPARAPEAGGKTAYDRALAQGGVWEQRLVACDQAGVNLVLRKTRKFGLTITTKCQGRKDVTEVAGTFVTEGSDTLVLEMHNEEGPDERLECRFTACDDAPEDCLTCASDDVNFTMQVVRR